MRITTWNVNGLRAALRKGFAEALLHLAPDVLMLQEVRATPAQLPPEWAHPSGWHVHWHPAQRPGYSGTAVWSRLPFNAVGTGLGRRGAKATDLEGRILQVQIAGLWLMNVYLPSGSASQERHQAKLSWMEDFFPWAARQARSRQPVLLGGDLNIAHTESDIFYASGNQQNSGFTPPERAWFGRLLDSGWSDLIRQQFGPCQGPYSWWSNRGQARQLDRGWRIDYLLSNRQASPQVQRAWIDRHWGLSVSDHAPVSIELDWPVLSY